MRLLCALTVLFLVAACQVRPLYAPAPEQDTGVASELAMISIVPVEGRVGQQIRNELDFLLNAGRRQSPRYELDLSTRTRLQDMLVRTVGGEPTNRTLMLQVSYTLKSLEDNTNLLRGTVITRATFEVSRQRFANDRAERNAADRAAREAAEELRMQIAAFLASDRSPRLDGAPDLELDDTLLGDDQMLDRDIGY